MSVINLPKNTATNHSINTADFIKLSDNQNELIIDFGKAQISLNRNGQIKISGTNLEQKTSGKQIFSASEIHLN